VAVKLARRHSKKQMLSVAGTVLLFAVESIVTFMAWKDKQTNIRTFTANVWALSPVSALARQAVPSKRLSFLSSVFFYLLEIGNFH
jgi:hypothetical protein